LKVKQKAESVGTTPGTSGLLFKIAIRQPYQLTQKQIKCMKFYIQLKCKTIAFKIAVPTLSKQTIMRINLTCLLLSLMLIQVSGAGFAQKISISKKNATLQQLLTEIKNQSGYDFLYKPHELKEAKLLDINVNDAELVTVLEEVFTGQPLTYIIDQNTIIIRRKTVTILNNITKPFSLVNINGIVLNREGEPMVGATVQVKNKKTIAITNERGEFELKGIEENAVIIVSFVGYIKQEVTIGKGNYIEVKLQVNTNELSEIKIMVSTGYQQISKERATGSYSLVTAKDLSNKLQTDISSRLEGMAAGYTSYRGTIRVRGTSTISGITTPLYVVDGFPYEGNLSAINPWEIESVTILKDATAASIYGSRSANGVIVITTKKGVANLTKVNYHGTIRLTGLEDNRSYLNLMNSSELVNFQQDMFNAYHFPRGILNVKTYLNEVRDLLYQREAGTITEEVLNTKLEEYRNTENRDQLIDNFLRTTAVTQQHNISLSGGSERYRYSASANYTKNLPVEKGLKDDRIGYNIKNTYDFFKWLRADIGLIGSYTNINNNNGFTAQNYLYGSRASYFNLTDALGNQIPWDQNKSKLEIDRLRKVGLYDETFYPLQELQRSVYTSKSNYTNLNLGLNFKIVAGLTFDAKYQLEKTGTFEKNFRDKNAYEQKTTINNATMIDANANKITFLVPQGGYVNETNADANSYTLRGQLNYTKSLNSLHVINAIAGGERRAVKTKTTFLEKWGYDDINLAHKLIDEVLLSTTKYGTQSITGMYTHKPNGYPRSFTESENRFISFYGNASYEYDRRFALSGSIRMDQSNLFGTDPKLQYRPLWSAGLSWNISNEKFMKGISWVDNLTLRATYGINGNIAKNSGPYLIVVDAGLNSFTQEFSSRISVPPNSGLRWEKTKQKNIGLDFRLFRNRLSGSVEYYNKDTHDLLGPITVDPTSGWSSLILNYASLYNKGYEITLNSLNITNGNFKWGTTFNFSFNKNRILKLETTTNAVGNYVGGINDRPGVAMGSLYSIRWAGLDEMGRPQAFKEDGKTIVKSLADLNLQDLVYSGTTVPPYAASLTNNFNYKGFYLSCMFIFYGGHVMRDVMPAYITNPDSYNVNINKNILNYWKKLGDEKDPDKSPAIFRNASSNVSDLWYAADKHILNAAYLKLREVTMGYEFPKQISKKIGMSSLSVNAQIQNLWYWSANKNNLDPESWNGSGTSTSRTSLNPKTYALGLSATF
jgi:TonB-linked SusC/RagA family outer membrane protein